jgi:D-3-phosphoglycerate dehydrogenase
MMNRSNGEYDYTILDIGGRVSDAAVEHLKQINGVLRIRVIR